MGVEAAKYDLEEYFLPPMVRKILKTTKPAEVFQVRCSSRAKLNKVVPYFDDPQGIFTKEILSSFEKDVVYTICLVAFEQKDYVFKVPIADKLARLSGIKALANDFMKAGLPRKALKCYNKVHMYFRTKDAKNNFQKEDDTTEAFTQATQELDLLNKTVLTNMCVIHTRKKDWGEVLRCADEALTVDPAYVKALFHRGRAQLERTEYQPAIDTLQEATRIDPENAEVKKELVRAEIAFKKYQERE